MCMMIYQPEGETIPAEHIRASVQMNPDGWGVVWRSEDGVKTRLDMNTRNAEGILSALGEHELIFHARAGTHGTTNWTNLHPFRIRLPDNSTWWMAHNGVFPQYRVPIIDPMRSDTNHFAKQIEAAAEDGTFNLQKVLETDEMKDYFERWVGVNNRVCFMGPSGVHILNEASGIWLNGLWYSNASLLVPGRKKGEAVVALDKIAKAALAAVKEDRIEVHNGIGAAEAWGDYPDTTNIKPSEAARVILEQLETVPDPYDCAFAYACSDPQALAIIVCDFIASEKEEAQKNAGE